MLGLRWNEKKSPVGSFYDLGTLGSNRVCAVKTEVGALGSGGTTRNAHHYFAATQATGLVCVGMAFGISRQQQRIGDVLVSESVFPYDVRKVLPRNPTGWAGFLRARWRREASWLYTYENASTYPSKRDLQQIFRQHQDRRSLGYSVQFGCLLAGSAKIASGAYRDELVRQCLDSAPSLIGGEMEGVGFLSLARRTNPSWIIVKGITDFADEKQRGDVQANRRQACANASSFVLEAVLEWKPANRGV